MSISGFLKVIHTPKTPQRGFFQVLQKLISSIAFFKSSQLGLPINLLNTPMSRVSCRNDGNFENQADQFRAFLHKMQIHHSSFGQLTLGMGVFRRFMGSPDCQDLKNAREEVNFRDT
jgi:hypothetical protein